MDFNFNFQLIDWCLANWRSPIALQSIRCIRQLVCQAVPPPQWVLAAQWHLQADCGMLHLAMTAVTCHRHRLHLHVCVLFSRFILANLSTRYFRWVRSVYANVSSHLLWTVFISVQPRGMSFSEYGSRGVQQPTSDEKSQPRTVYAPAYLFGNTPNQPGICLYILALALGSQFTNKKMFNVQIRSKNTDWILIFVKLWVVFRASTSQSDERTTSEYESDGG